MKSFLLAAVGLMVLSAGAKDAVRAVLFPFREAVIASRVESRLLPYGFRVGEPFKAQSVLVKLDDERFQLEKKRAEDLYKFNLASFENKQKLREKNFTSDFELKKAEYEKNSAENALLEARLNCSYCLITAPFEGKIVEILTREYETVRPGQPICRIIDDNYLLAVMNVPMDEKSLTTVGSPVRIRLDSGMVVSGEIYEVSPQADHRTGTLRIRVKIDNRQGKVTAGATGVLIYGE